MHGLGLALLGAVAVGGGVIGFSGFYVGRWTVALVGGLVALVLGAAVARGVREVYAPKWVRTRG